MYVLGRCVSTFKVNPFVIGILTQAVKKVKMCLNLLKLKLCNILVSKAS